jgi:hypothetical protein
MITQSAQVTFDEYLARQARDNSMAQVEENADEEWKRVARQAIQQVAKTRREFTSDAVLEIIESHKPPVWTHEPRALGPLMMAAMRQGLIQRTDRVVKSCDISRHAAEKRVWKSLVFGVTSQ